MKWSGAQFRYLETASPQQENSVEASPRPAGASLEVSGGSRSHRYVDQRGVRKSNRRFDAGLAADSHLAAASGIPGQNQPERFFGRLRRLAAILLAGLP